MMELKNPNENKLVWLICGAGLLWFCWHHAFQVVERSTLIEDGYPVVLITGADPYMVFLACYLTLATIQVFLRPLIKPLQNKTIFSFLPIILIGTPYFFNPTAFDPWLLRPSETDYVECAYQPASDSLPDYLPSDGVLMAVDNETCLSFRAYYADYFHQDGALRTRIARYNIENFVQALETYGKPITQSRWELQNMTLERFQSSPSSSETRPQP